MTGTPGHCGEIKMTLRGHGEDIRRTDIKLKEEKQLKVKLPGNFFPGRMSLNIPRIKEPEELCSWLVLVLVLSL